MRTNFKFKWADLLDTNATDLAVLVVRDNGTEIGMAIKAEPASAANTIRYYAEALDKIYGGANNTVPLGGLGQSGNGSDKSLHAIGKYVNLKTAWIKL